MKTLVSRSVVLLSAATALAVFPGQAAAQTVVSVNAPNAASFNNFQELTIGQSFRAPNATDLLLESFQISISSSTSVPFVARLMEWNSSTQVAGALLFEEAVASSPQALAFFTFTTNRALTFDRDYMFSLSMSPSLVLIQSQATADDQYAGGGLRIIAASALSALQSSEWSALPGDVGFTASFKPLPVSVPEPSSLALLAISATTVAAASRRRRARVG